MLGKVAARHCARAWGAGLVLVAKKRLEAKRRDRVAFRSISPSLTTSVAEAFFVFIFLEPGPAPAAWE